ncbi:NAD(P)-dependent oxidoreductase [soil metagenome]|nr:NAD(P)-dependent oxidoreductase [Trueperaceae bacterium]
MRTVLVTGAAGRVGGVIRPRLRERYALRLLDRAPVLDVTAGEVARQGDLLDAPFLDASMNGVDAVVHLACVHAYDIPFEGTLDANYRTLLHVLDASVRHGVRRFVYTSSHHVHGLHPRSGFSGDEASLAPDGFYALSKAFGEAACALYAHRFDLPTLVIRVGNADPLVGDDRRMRLWTSGRDLADLITIGFEHPDVRYDVVYGVSQCEGGLYANVRAGELGYAPHDDARDHLAPDFAPYERMRERDGRDFVGGPYVATALPGPGVPS